MKLVTLTPSAPEDGLMIVKARDADFKIEALGETTVLNVEVFMMLPIGAISDNAPLNDFLLEAEIDGDYFQAEIQEDGSYVWKKVEE